MVIGLQKVKTQRITKIDKKKSDLDLTRLVCSEGQSHSPQSRIVHVVLFRFSTVTFQCRDYR